jgi:hypothetical protein
MAELENLVNNGARTVRGRRQVGAWDLPQTSADDLGFALKCVRSAPPPDYGQIVAALEGIGRAACWIGEDEMTDLARKTGSPLSFLRASIARVNAWLASAGDYVRHFGVPYGTAGYKGEGVLHQGGIPTAVILAGDYTSLTAWSLGQGLLSGSPLIVKPSNVEPLSALLFTRAVIDQGIRAPNLLFLDSSEESEREMIRKAILHCGQSVIYGEDATVSAVYSGLALLPAHKAIPYWSGRSGALVLPDADLEAAARDIVRGAALDRGNMCNSTKKVLAPASLRSPFEALLVQEAEAIRRGDPTDEATELGRLDPVGRKMAERNAAGSRIFYDRDLVLASCEDGSPLLLEETPYPIVGVRYYQDSEDPVRLANETVRDAPSGRALVMSVFSDGPDPLRQAAGLRAFKVLHNAPTARVDHFAMHQGIHLALELMRPVAFP